MIESPIEELSDHERQREVAKLLARGLARWMLRLRGVSEELCEIPSNSRPNELDLAAEKSVSVPTS